MTDLQSLLTARDVARILGITSRRVRVIAHNRRARGVDVGFQLPGGQWLFRPEDVELLRPDEKYRVKEAQE